MGCLKIFSLFGSPVWPAIKSNSGLFLQIIQGVFGSFVNGLNAWSIY